MGSRTGGATNRDSAKDASSKKTEKTTDKGGAITSQKQTWSKELFREAERVLDLALSAYPPGKMLAAAFKNGFITKTVCYVNPRDIPAFITIEYRNTLYLYSVQTYEKMQDQTAHERAVELQKKALEQAKHSLYGTTEEDAEEQYQDYLKESSKTP